MIDIRSYRGSDLDPLLTIMNQVVARGDAFVYDEPFDVASMRGWIATYAQVFVAENHGRVVGAYLLRPNFAGRGAHVCNAAYMVDARARGLGVGNRMAEHSLAAAKSLGYSSMQFNAPSRPTRPPSRCGSVGASRSSAHPRAPAATTPRVCGSTHSS